MWIKKIAIGSMLAASVLMAGNSNKTLNLEKFKNISFIKQNKIKVLGAKDWGELYQLKLKLNRGAGGNFYAFVTKDLKYFIVGQGFDTKSGKELTIPVDMEKLKKDAAFVIGSGKEEFFLFTDPECPYCKKFEEKMERLKDRIKIYVYFFPLSFHQNAEKMSLYILSKDKKERWKALKEVSIEGKTVYKDSEIDEDAKKELAKQIKLASKLGIRGTPTIFDKNGREIPSEFLVNKYMKKVDFKGIEYLLKKGMAIKMGKGKEPLFVFTDTDCPHCQKMYSSERFKKLLDKYTFYFFLYPLPMHKDAQAETVYILTKPESERGKWFSYFMKGKRMDERMKKEIEDILEKPENLKKVMVSYFVAEKMGIKGTPTIVDKHGYIVDPASL